MVMRYIQENKNMLVLSEDDEFLNFVKEKKSKKEIDEFIKKCIRNKGESYGERYNMLIVPDYRIKVKKNLYLSFFEKTYNENSLLYLNYLLKINYDINSLEFSVNYYDKILKNVKNIKEIFFLNY